MTPPQPKYYTYSRQVVVSDRWGFKITKNILAIPVHLQYIVISNQITLKLSNASFILNLHELVLIWHIKSG